MPAIDVQSRALVDQTQAHTFRISTPAVCDWTHSGTNPKLP